VTIVRPTLGLDVYGDLRPTGVTARFELSGCVIAPRLSGDIVEPARQGVMVGLSLYAQVDADIRPTDQVEVDGALYDIDGDIARWRSPYSAVVDGVEVALRRAIA
jgi:hypothetical protein